MLLAEQPHKNRQRDETATSNPIYPSIETSRPTTENTAILPLRFAQPTESSTSVWTIQGGSQSFWYSLICYYLKIMK